MTKPPMFYKTQEKAMAPGIAGEWPRVIPKPGSPHGRLVRIDGLEEFLEEVLDYAINRDVDDWERRIELFLGRK